jgi:hypothetical protein
MQIISAPTTTHEVGNIIQAYQAVLLPALPPLQSLANSSKQGIKHIGSQIHKDRICVHPRYIEPIRFVGHTAFKEKNVVGSHTGRSQIISLYVSPLKVYAYYNKNFSDLPWESFDRLMKASETSIPVLKTSMETLQTDTDSFIKNIIHIGISRFGSIFTEELAYRAYLCMHACPSVKMNFLHESDKKGIQEIIDRSSTVLLRKPKFLSLIHEISMPTHARYEYYYEFADV